MSNVTPLLTAVGKNNEEAVAQLRDALRRAEAGCKQPVRCWSWLSSGCAETKRGAQ